MEEKNKRQKNDKNIMEIFFIIIAIVLIVFLIICNMGKLNNFIPTGYVDIFDLHFANASNKQDENGNKNNNNNSGNKHIASSNGNANNQEPNIDGTNIDNNNTTNNNNNNNENNNENNGNNTENNNNTGDDNKGDDDKKDDDDKNLHNNRVDVYDDKIVYQNNQAEIFRHSAYYILDGKIAPTSRNSYQFIVRNGNSFNVKYNLIMKEKNDYNINMRFRLKLNGRYVVGNSKEWVTADKIKQYEIKLANNSYDTYTLDWCWFEGENDTEIGMEIESKYKVYIGVYAEQY